MPARAERDYLTIQDLAGNTITHQRLTRGACGKGTWQEVEEHLTAAGYKIHTGFVALTAAGILAATLTST